MQLLSWKTACLELAELPEPLAIVQAARRGEPQTRNRHSLWSSWRQGQNSKNHLDDNVCPAVRVISDIMMTEPAQVVGRAQRARPQPQQRRGTDLHVKLDKRKARSVCHACGQTQKLCQETLNAPGRLFNVIELEG